MTAPPEETYRLPDGWGVTRMAHLSHACGWTASVTCDEPWRIRQAMEAHAIAGCAATPADTPEG